jgi:hypothetical protein
MAGNKYIQNNAGVLTEAVAIQTSGGATDAGKIPALDTSGRLDSSMMPVGLGAEADVIPASENLAAGNLVNIWSNSGAANARKADATTAGKEAVGFVLAAVTAPANATVYRTSQSNTQMSGLTPGAKYFLATTAGGITATAPSGSGNVVQSIGTAINATTLSFNPGAVVVLA